MPTYERLDYGSPDGSQWGGSADLLGMYGVTPVARQAVLYGNVSTATHASTAISSLIVALNAVGIVSV